MRLELGSLKERDVRALIQAISNICNSEEFATLKQELENLYDVAGIENPAVSAFQDTLFALLCQQKEEPEIDDDINRCTH